MLHSGIQPDATNYTLLLRTARDCGIGDPSVATSLLLTPNPKHTARRGSKSRAQKDAVDIDLLERQLLVQPEALSGGQQDGRDTEVESTGGDSTSLVPVRQTHSLPVASADDCTASPNLLDVFAGKRSDVISLGTAEKAADRLALIGGAEGLLEKMEAEGLSPNLRTLTLLADTMTSGSSSLQLLLWAAKKHRVKLDVAFFNSAIRTAAKASDLEGAKVQMYKLYFFVDNMRNVLITSLCLFVIYISSQALLGVMRQRNVSVDVQTFGCLALGCEKEKDGLQLLKDMEVIKIPPKKTKRHRALEQRFSELPTGLKLPRISFLAEVMGSSQPS